MKKITLSILMVIAFLSAKSQTVKYVLQKSTLTYASPNAYAHVVTTLSKGDTVLITDYKEGYWTIDFKNSRMYAFEPQWDNTSLNEFKSKFKLTQERIKVTTMTIGMFADDVIDLYGNPSHKNTTSGAWGTHEQWVYNSPYVKVKYVYIENGKVTSWQE